jgi:hypothetical protein
MAATCAVAVLRALEPRLCIAFLNGVEVNRTPLLPLSA